MRNCRVCLVPDINNCYDGIFDYNGKVVSEIFQAFNITIVELAKPAFICRRCTKNISIAAELKKTILKANVFFKRDYSDERFMWHENLRELKNFEPVEGINSEPVEQNDEDDLIMVMNDTELDQFMKEADDVLTQSLFEMASETTKIVSERKDVKEEIQDDTASIFADTVVFSEVSCDSFESDLAFITMDQIHQMTDKISDLLLKCEKPKKTEVKQRKKKGHLTSVYLPERTKKMNASMKDILPKKAVLRSRISRPRRFST